VGRSGRDGWSEEGNWVVDAMGILEELCELARERRRERERCVGGDKARVVETGERERERESVGPSTTETTFLVLCAGVGFLWDKLPPLEFDFLWDGGSTWDPYHR
jgi:hypothetical protein